MKRLNLLLVILLICSVVLGLFHFLRFSHTKQVEGYDQYVYLLNNNSTGLDDYFSHPEKILLAPFKQKIFAMRAIPYLFGLLNIYLISLILKDIMHERKQRFITCIVILLSPAFIYYHTHFNSVFMILSFVLIGIHSLVKDRYLLALVSLLATIIFNPQIFLVILFILILFYEKTKGKHLLALLIGLMASFMIYLTINSPPEMGTFFIILSNNISDLGAYVGFGIFSLVLSLLGIILSWKDKSKHFFVYIVLGMLLYLSSFEKGFMLFAGLGLCFYGGLALAELWKSRWKSEILKNYLILLILCGLMFSAGSYINKLSRGSPQDAETIALSWLKDNNDGGKVLSYYSYGYLIESMSGLLPYTDTSYFFNSKDKLKIKDSEDFFNSRDLPYIKSFLEKRDIGYIWITPEMKNGLIWERDGDGVLLIFENSLNFRKIFSYDGFDIWEFQKEVS